MCLVKFKMKQKRRGQMCNALCAAPGSLVLWEAAHHLVTTPVSFLKCDDQTCLQYSRYRCTKVFYKNRIIWALWGLLLFLCLLAPKSSPEAVKYCIGVFVYYISLAWCPQGWSSSFQHWYSSYCLKGATDALSCCYKVAIQIFLLPLPEWSPL